MTTLWGLWCYELSSKTFHRRNHGWCFGVLSKSQEDKPSVVHKLIWGFEAGRKGERNIDMGSTCSESDFP